MYVETARSYLEFGKEQDGKKTPYDTRYEQEAYDFFMVARYAKDIIGYNTGNLSLIHHKEDIEDNVKKYVALQVCKRNDKQLVFYEIGSSLMGVIDALEYFTKKKNSLIVKDILFAGVDNSWMMNDLAHYLHREYKLAVTLEQTPVVCDVFFAKGVSLLYACDNEEDFCAALKRSRIAIFDYTFSIGDSISEFVGTGKPVVFLRLNECKKLLEDNNKVLILTPSKRFGHTDKRKQSYEVLYADKDLIHAYQKELEKQLSFFIHTVNS